MSKISISTEIAPAESKDLQAIKLIQATLKSQLGDNEYAQLRVLQYCEQKVCDKLMESSLSIGQLAQPLNESNGDKDG